MASVEDVALASTVSMRTAPAMIHVVDGTARSGRVRRVEYVRRFFNSQALVVGCLDDECRCAGLGLRAIGSAPKRSLCSALAQTIRFERVDGRSSLLVCAWSTAVALETASMFKRLLLVADQLPPPDLDRALAGRIEVIAPDSEIALAWSRSGARRTRILPPCALAAGAPSSAAGAEPVSVALYTREGGSDEDALGLLHRAGLVHLGGVAVQIRLNVSNIRSEVMFEYARRTGFDEAILAMEPGAFPGDVQIAMVGGVRGPQTDERVLDLVAQGVAVMAFSDEPSSVDQAVTLDSCGIEQFESAETNAGARLLTILAEDRELLCSAQSRAREFAATRDPRHWCATLGVAASSLED